MNTYEKPIVEVIHFDNDFMTSSSDYCEPGHGDHGNHYGWGDPQPGHGNDGNHGHNHGGNHRP